MAGKMKKGTTKEVTFSGFIEEIELEDGEMGLQIDDGSHAYLIVMDDIGRKLKRHSNEEVDVTGVMTHTANGRELKVNTFHLTEDYSYDDDDAYDQEDGDYFDGDDRFGD